jgi:hypothetical protein
MDRTKVSRARLIVMEVNSIGGRPPLEVISEVTPFDPDELVFHHSW